MTDEEIKTIVIEESILHGVPNEHAVLFDSLDIEFKNGFNKVISGREFGLPIIRFIHSNGFWVLIGTKELAWSDGSIIQFVEHNKIERIESLDYEQSKSKESDPILVKFQVEEVGLITKDDKTITLHIEKKAPYFAFQNLMIQIMKLI